MVETKVFNTENKPRVKEKNDIVDFLFENLEEYGDPRPDILKAVDYALMEYTSFGGFVLLGIIDDEIIGAVVVNQTGMKDYIPENILVYIATHKKHRGKGLGRQLMLEAINLAEGSVALHVEPDNPARFLYEKVGFTSKYVEMRYKKA